MTQESKHIQLQDSIEKETITLNIGPTHPATHGVFQNIVEIDGERILKGDSTIGYIHRAFEKIAEHRPFYQVTPPHRPLKLLLSPNQQYGVAYDR